MCMHVSDAPKELAIPFILPLVYPEQTHPGTMMKAGFLLLMECLNCAPQWPGTLVLIPVEQLKVKVHHQSSNDTNCHPLRLVPRNKFLGVGGCNRIMQLSCTILCTFDHTNMIVRGEIHFDSPGPLLEVAVGKQQDK